LGPLFITPPSSSVLSFTAPVTVDDVAMVAGRKESEFDMWNFTKILSDVRMILLILCLLTLSAVLIILSKESERSFENWSKVCFPLSSTVLNQCEH